MNILIKLILATALLSGSAVAERTYREQTKVCQEDTKLVAYLNAIVENVTPEEGLVTQEEAKQIDTIIQKYLHRDVDVHYREVMIACYGKEILKERYPE